MSDALRHIVCPSCEAINRVSAMQRMFARLQQPQQAKNSHISMLNSPSPHGEYPGLVGEYRAGLGKIAYRGATACGWMRSSLRAG